jgi:2-C-methyl-D-erythritol 2,4-cyclodiphosphate synthase
MRVGIGYDIHKFGSEPPLVLGGTTFPSEPRLIGHSDGDALFHAVADAVLGAAALGDIGEHFPDTDDRWEDADSAAILGEALRLVREGRGLVPVNVDVNVITQRPRLGARKQALRRRLAEVLDIAEDCVSIKARTHEGVGPVGRGEALEVQAIVLLREVS